MVKESCYTDTNLCNCYVVPKQSSRLAMVFCQRARSFLGLSTSGSNSATLQIMALTAVNLGRCADGRLRFLIWLIGTLEGDIEARDLAE